MAELVLLTRDATLDDMSRQDYVEAYQELRVWDEGEQKFALTLRQWVGRIGTPPSEGEWSRLDRGEIDFTRAIRNKLRTLAGRPPLPLTVAEVIADNVGPDATVYRLGAGVGENVVIVGAVPTGTSLYVNGSVAVVEPSDEPIASVRARTTSRRPMFRPVLPVELKAEVEEVGESVEELVRFALRMKKQGAWW